MIMLTFSVSTLVTRVRSGRQIIGYVLFLSIYTDMASLKDAPFGFTLQEIEVFQASFAALFQLIRCLREFRHISVHLLSTNLHRVS